MSERSSRNSPQTAKIQNVLRKVGYTMFTAKLNKENSKPTMLAIRAYGKNEPYTDTASAYITHVAPKLAYVALRSIYAKSGNDYIRRIMDQCTTYSRIASNAEYLSMVENTMNENPHMQARKKHTYKYVTLPGKPAKACKPGKPGKPGKPAKALKFRVEIIPKYSLHFTEYGKLAMEDVKASTSVCEFSDVVQVATLAIIELCNAGFIQDFRDVWSYTNHVYKRISAFIYAERKANTERKAYQDMISVSAGYDEDNSYSEKHIVGEKAVLDFYSGLEKEDLVSIIREFVIPRLDSRCDKVKTITAFTMAIHGATLAEIGEKLNVSAQTASVHVNRVKSILRSPAGYEFLKDLF